MTLVLYSSCSTALSSFFFFNDTATTEIYTLSLHDALPISRAGRPRRHAARRARVAHSGLRDPRLHGGDQAGTGRAADRKSTRLNSSHLVISYAVFCLKKKKKKQGLRSSSRKRRSLTTRRAL